jgi:hypothetical protein
MEQRITEPLVMAGEKEEHNDLNQGHVGSVKVSWHVALHLLRSCEMEGLPAISKVWDAQETPAIQMVPGNRFQLR